MDFQALAGKANNTCLDVSNPFPNETPRNGPASRFDHSFTPQETDRYIVMPGQDCSYMIGQLRILELREKAKKGAGIQVRDQRISNVILRCGCAPLEVLAEEVEAWITPSKKAK